MDVCIYLEKARHLVDSYCRLVNKKRTKLSHFGTMMHRDGQAIVNINALCTSRAASLIFNGVMEISF